MSEKIVKRLDELKKEFESGQKMMMELDSRRENLRETLLRISGAIQVLEEQLKDEEAGDNHGKKPASFDLALVDHNKSDIKEPVNHKSTVSV